MLDLPEKETALPRDIDRIIMPGLMDKNMDVFQVMIRYIVSTNLLMSIRA